MRCILRIFDYKDNLINNRPRKLDFFSTIITSVRQWLSAASHIVTSPFITLQPSKYWIILQTIRFSNEAMWRMLRDALNIVSSVSCATNAIIQKYRKLMNLCTHKTIDKLIVNVTCITAGLLESKGQQL